MKNLLKNALKNLICQAKTQAKTPPRMIQISPGLALNPKDISAMAAVYSEESYQRRAGVMLTMREGVCFFLYYEASTAQTIHPQGKALYADLTAFLMNPVGTFRSDVKVRSMRHDVSHDRVYNMSLYEGK